LSVLKAGGAYVPLDHNLPSERLKNICEVAHLKLILSQGCICARLHAVENVPVFKFETDWARRVSSLPTSRLENLSNLNDLAYVLFTSGTTGQPKGVALPHLSARGLVEWIRQTFSRQELSGVLGSTSIGFDMSGFEILGCLCRGGCLILVENVLDAMDYSGNRPITLINTVPSAMAELLRAGGIPPSVKTVVLAGEPLPTWLVDQLYQVPGIERVFDSYGPTETSYSTLCLREAGCRPTIGKPLPGWKVYILDEKLCVLPVGIPGEIYIGGIGMARGYYGRPDLTAEHFLSNPYEGEAGERFYRTGDLGRWLADGNIEYLGRTDTQVKIRGYRIELGEIETAIRQYSEVNQVLVVAREDQPGERRLVAYIVSTSDGTLDTDELRRFLEVKLPAYMLPSIFVQLKAFPLTVNGKIDRKALPVPDQNNLAGKRGVVLPRDALEHQLVEIWEKLLNIQPIGIEDNFFELGGHSLLAVRLFTQIEGIIGRKLPLVTLFQCPTINSLAGIIRVGNQFKTWSSLV